MTPPSSQGSPLSATLAAVAGLGQCFAASLDGGGGRRLASLAADRPALDRALAAVCARWRTADRSVAASFFLGDVAWRVAGPLAASYLAQARVPAVDPQTVAVPVGADGVPGPATFTTAAVCALPADRDAGHPDVVIVADPAALRAALRRTVATTLAGLVPALRPWARRSPATQWRQLSDVVAGALSWSGEMLGDAARGCAEAERVLDGTPPFTGRADWRRLTHGGARRVMHGRAACCLAYRLDGHGYCLTCPLEDDDVRLVRWRASMEEEP